MRRCQGWGSQGQGGWASGGSAVHKTRAVLAQARLKAMKKLNLCLFALNFFLISICRRRIPLNYGGSFVHLHLKAAPPPRNLLHRSCPQNVQRDKRSSEVSKAATCQRQSHLPASCRGGQRHARGYPAPASAGSPCVRADDRHKNCLTLQERKMHAGPSSV